MKQEIPLFVDICQDEKRLVNTGTAHEFSSANFNFMAMIATAASIATRTATALNNGGRQEQMEPIRQ